MRLLPTRAFVGLLVLSLSCVFVPTTLLAQTAELIEITTVDENALTFAVGPAARFASTVNGRSHQQDPLVTYRGYQYVTYVDAQRRICLGRRKLPTGSFDVIRFNDHKLESNDAHNTSVIGICDTDGTIHMAFDHHASQLNYRVSKQGAAHHPDSVAWNADLFGGVTHTLGSVVPAERVTYPRFFAAPDGDLMLYYRSVTSGNGDGMIEKYDGETHDWKAGFGKFISRDMGTYLAGDRVSDYRCPYMNCLSFAGNRLHASWVWRERFEKTNPANQHDLCYVYSDDLGRTWQNSAGQVIGRTGLESIHLDSPGLVVVPIPRDARVANQNTHYAFDDGSIHMVMKQRVRGTNEPRYHHYWRTNEGSWDFEVLPFSGSRPKLVGTPDRTMLLVSCDEVEGSDKDELFVLTGAPNIERTGWKWSKVKLQDRYFICGEPLLDRQRWESEKVLSVYSQEAPAKIIHTRRTEPVDGVASPIHVLDFRLFKQDRASE